MLALMPLVALAAIPDGDVDCGKKKNRKKRQCRD